MTKSEKRIIELEARITMLEAENEELLSRLTDILDIAADTFAEDEDEDEEERKSDVERSLEPDDAA